MPSATRVPFTLRSQKKVSALESFYLIFLKILCMCSKNYGGSLRYIYIYTHSPISAVVTFRKVRRYSNFAQIRTEYTYHQICMYIQGNPSEIQTPTQGNLIGRNMTAPSLCYRPAVFFHPLRLIALSLPQGKFGAGLKCRYLNCIIFNLSKSKIA